MDFKKLKKDIEKSTNLYTTIESEHKVQIKNEVNTLKAFINYLLPSLPVEVINGNQAVLIYVYDDSPKKTISNKVYYCLDGKIRYQVFKKEEYLGYNPTVQYEGAYAMVDAEEHFSKRNGLELSDVVDFLFERVDVLKEMASELHESLELRKQYLDSFRKVAREYF